MKRRADRRSWWALYAAVATWAACVPAVGPIEDVPSTLVVTPTGNTRTGCPGDGPLLEFEEEVLTFRVEARDAFGEPFAHNGPVAFRMNPGRLGNPGLRYSMVNGVLPVAPVEVGLSFGQRARVWAELATPEGRQATGLSPELCFKTPKISDVQFFERGSHDTRFDGEQVVFQGDRLIATATDSRGFYVTDVDQPDYGSIYVFTFGNPTGIKPGACICEVSGGIQEFLAFTEVVFPTWRVHKKGGREAAASELEDERIRVGDDEVPDPRHDESLIFTECDWAKDTACDLADAAEREALTVPAPVRIDPESLPDVGIVPWDDSMIALDKHEATLVAIGPLHLPQHFENCDKNGDGEVTRCFSRSSNPDQSCAALERASEEDVLAVFDRGEIPGGGCSCGEAALRESFCTNKCAATPGCAEEGAYREFGQYGVTAGAGDRRMNLITRVGLPSFVPVQDPRTTIHCVVGNLKQVAAAPIPWVVQPRRASDVMFDPPASIEDDPCAQR